MKFDAPATRNPVDELKVVGKPVDRIDGRLKVTGTATYAYENRVPNAAYGYILGSASSGKIDGRNFAFADPLTLDKHLHRLPQVS
jgi:xanthine dehydrogenase YagR molybdenum-binding subunit